MIKTALKTIARTAGGPPVYAKVELAVPSARMEGKTAFVTGATSGIGLAIAKRFIDEGAIVHAAGRDISKIKNYASLDSSRLVLHTLDVRDCQNIEVVMSKAFTPGPIDVLVNSAGVYRSTSFFSCSKEDWDEMLSTNLGGLFLCSKSFCQHLIDLNRGGSVINMASNTGVIGAWAGYGACKQAVCGLTEGLGKELLRYGITVNAIAPGPVATPINGRTSDSELGYPPASDGRMALPEEVAELALYLASPAARHITGQVVALDGGESCTCIRC